MNPTEKQFLNDWEDIISKVEKTTFPMEFVDYISVKPIDSDEEPQEVDVHGLKLLGYDTESLNEIVMETLREYDEDKFIISFAIDIKAVAFKAQKMTDGYCE